MSRQQQQSSMWTKIVLGLSAIVLILAVTAFVLSRQNTGGLGTDHSSSQSSNPSSSSDQTIDSEHTTTGDETGPSDTLDGLSFDAAIAIAVDGAATVELPGVFAEGGFNLLHVLTDGRLVLQNAKRISIYDPISLEETIVAEADFGLQGTANDRFIVYGEGGDEVFKLEVYTISSGVRSVILEDPNGYFGFEIDEQNHFYTSKVEALKYGKQMTGWIEYDLVSGQTVTHDGSVRSLGNRDLMALDPSLNLSWQYEIGQIWYEAWRLSERNSFAMGIEYLDIYQELYRYSLYKIGGELEVILEAAEGSRPFVHTEGNLFVFDRHYFYDPVSLLWYRLNTDDLVSALTLSADRESLYLATGKSAGFWEELQVLPFEVVNASGE